MLFTNATLPRCSAYGPQPKTENVKLTFICPVSLKADLDRYAALRAQTCGEAVDAEKLIPHMLEAFMAGDRGFRKGHDDPERAIEAGMMVSRIIQRHPLSELPQAARFSFRMPPSLLGYDDATDPPLLGNPARRSAMRLSLPTLLCGF